MDDLLTTDEHDLIALLGECANRFAAIAGDSLSRDGDLAEVFSRIHDLQSRVMAQAAARAYPLTYRPLGGFVEREKPHNE